ncbi:MAG TPA: Uma2 family endonuclease [Thermoanaerobaculia bacterium]|nr:Uma2 family endonuclease [Thermoanaerobaculia bacterium]
MTSRKWTYEDLLRLPYDGLRHEIIDGVHYATEAHYTKHQRVTAQLKSLLHYLLQDRFFYRNEYARTVMGTYRTNGSRELMIEIIPMHKKHYDEASHVEAALREGVVEYWLIHPALDAVRVFRRAGDRFQQVDVGDTLTTPLLPGFTLSLQKLFV